MTCAVITWLCDTWSNTFIMWYVQQKHDYAICAVITWLCNCAVITYYIFMCMKLTRSSYSTGVYQPTLITSEDPYELSRLVNSWFSHVRSTNIVLVRKNTSACYNRSLKCCMMTQIIPWGRNLSDKLVAAQVMYKSSLIKSYKLNHINP